MPLNWRQDRRQKKSQQEGVRELKHLNKIEAFEAHEQIEKYLTYLAATSFFFSILPLKISKPPSGVNF